MMLINYFLSAIYGIWFLFLLGVFHPIQWIAYNVFGANAHRKVVELLNFGILYGQWIVGSRISFKQNNPIPKDFPLIFVANHQSMYDIVGIIWFLRKYNPVFVSKKSLASGIPSISYNLRKSGAALIERKNKSQAVRAIARLGKHIEETQKSAVIFPEGTRSRTGLKRFSTSGLETLIRTAPSSVIVPIVINGTGHMDAFNTYPIRSFQKISWTTLEPIYPKGRKIEEIIKEAKSQIQSNLIEH